MSRSIGWFPTFHKCPSLCGTHHPFPPLAPTTARPAPSRASYAHPSLPSIVMSDARPGQLHPARPRSASPTYEPGTTTGTGAPYSGTRPATPPPRSPTPPHHIGFDSTSNATSTSSTRTLPNRLKSAGTTVVHHAKKHMGVITCDFLHGNQPIKRSVRLVLSVPWHIWTQEIGESICKLALSSAIDCCLLFYSRVCLQSSSRQARHLIQKIDSDVGIGLGDQTRLCNGLRCVQLPNFVPVSDIP